MDGSKFTIRAKGCGMFVNAGGKNRKQETLNYISLLKWTSVGTRPYCRLLKERFAFAVLLQVPA